MNAHLVTAYASSSPAQEAAAVGLRVAERDGFWKGNNADVRRRVGRICGVLRELGIPVRVSCFCGRSEVAHEC